MRDPAKGWTEMSLFLEAAQAWQQLMQTEYRITAVRRGKIDRFCLHFDPADFPHLAGMQYAKDVDFGLRPTEYYGEKLLFALLRGKMDGSRIEKSRSWEKISGRLRAIIRLEQTLESDFLLARFDPGRVYCGSKINADFVIQNRDSQEIFFVFIDKSNESRYYCKSAFQKAGVDYIQNQSILTVLKKEKWGTGAWQVLYRHPHLREEQEEALSL